MRANRWTVLSTAVLGTALLGACGADGPVPAAGSPASGSDDAVQAPSPGSPAAGAAAQDDAAICTAVGDVLTIVENADAGLAEGRMAAQEHDGWYQLATRVLDRLPAGGDSAVQAAVAALQDAAPTAPSGTSAESTGVRSPAWSQAMTDLGTGCDAVGAPLAISVFTGG